jgi:protein-S-isoprenylcysteine O-methyltransferase Ste14
MTDDLQRAVVHFLQRTPVRTFVLAPILVGTIELLLRQGKIAFDPLGLPLLAWGYLQYRLAGWFRAARGGGGPGIEVPPQRIVTEGIYRLTRNPMYLGHLIFFFGLAITFRSAVALVVLVGNAVWFHRRVLADEVRLKELFGADYEEYLFRVKRWIPGIG